MAETLSELLVKIKTDSAELEKGLTDAEKQTEASSKKMQDSLKKVGMAMAASGAAITAALGLMGKAAIDEDINIKKLAITLKNAGISYDDVKDSIEAVIAATQRKTGISDNEQRDILSRLILITGDYNDSLSLLPDVLNLATIGEMEANTAATYLGKAFMDLKGGAEEVGVRFGQATVQFKDMAEIQTKLRGAAEAMANPLSVLKASIGDVAESIGINLIPLIKDATSKIVDISIKVKEWVEEHPALARVLTLTALGLGVVLTVIGGLILAMPVITSLVAAFGVVFHAALGPIGRISLVIMGLITVGILLWKNWDTIWSAIKNVTLRAVEVVLGGLAKFLGWIPGIGPKIKAAHDAISNMIDSAKVKRDAKAMTETIRAELGKQKESALAAFTAQKSAAKDLYDSNIRKIKEEYGEFKTVTKNKLDLAKDLHDESIRMLELEYDQKIRTLNAEADYQIKAIQEQIDAIDNQTEQEDRALTIQAEQKRLKELQATGTAEEIIAYETEIRRNALLRQRQDEKESLRQQIDAIRENTRQAQDNLKNELDTVKTAKDNALKEELTRLEEERAAKEELEKQRLNLTLTTIADEETAIKASFDARLTEAALYQAALQATLVDIEQTVTTHYVSTSDGGGGSIQSPSGVGFSTPGFATGGVVPGPIGMPQLATVHGGETIIPANESMGNIVVNFTQPVFFDREDTMNRFVDIISKGIDRKYRLNGRSLE